MGISLPIPSNYDFPFGLGKSLLVHIGMFTALQHSGAANRGRLEGDERHDKKKETGRRSEDSSDYGPA